MTKFEVKTKEYELHETYLTEQELESNREEKDACLLEEELEPINDDEENEAVSGSTEAADTTQPVAQSDHDHEREEEGSPNLPEPLQRLPGRSRKHPQRDDFLKY